MDAEHQRRGEVGEGPDEDEERARHVPRCRERQGDPDELGEAASADALGRLLERGIDLGERVDDVQGDHRKEVEGLHEQHAVQPVDEVHRPREPHPVLEQHVHGPGAPHDEGESEHADQRRRDDRNQGQVAEEAAADEVVAHEQDRHREPHHGGRRHGAETERQRVPERAQVVGVARELGEVRDGHQSGLVGERVVEDAQQRIDEKDEQEEPDDADAEPGHEAARDRGAPGGGRRDGAAHPSAKVSAAEAGKVTCTAARGGRTSWCQGSPTSTLSTTPSRTSTS